MAGKIKGIRNRFDCEQERFLTPYIFPSTYAITSNVYDGPNLISTTVTDQTSTNVLSKSSMSYDELNQLLSEIDYLSGGSSTVTDNTYDGTDLVGTTVTEGSSVLSEQSFTYDEAGNRLTTTDAFGNVSINTYDGSRLTATEITTSAGAEVNVTSWTYTESGSVATTVDGDGNATVNTWDGSNLTKAVVIDTAAMSVSTTAYSYNEMGEQIAVTNANGEVIDSNYDGGNLVNQTWYNAGGGVQDYLTWDYDEQMNVIAASNDEGTYDMTYDGNRLMTQAGPTGISLTYGYDLAGDVTTIVDSSGATTAMTYNAVNEVVKKSYTDGTNTLFVNYTYDMAGDVLTETRYSNLAGTTEVGYTNYGYNGTEMTSIAAYTMSGGSATQVMNYTYAYDADGRLTSFNNGTTVTSYSYDAANELTAAGSQTYTYDKAGNRTVSGTILGPNNQLQSDGINNYTYDAAGNMITQQTIATGVTWTYGYNATNQLLTAVQKNSGGTTLESVIYTYDVYGNRLSEAVTASGSTTTTDYVYTAAGTMYATLVSSAIQTRYIADVQGADHWEAQVTAAGAQWLQADYQGSVVQITSLTGTGVQTLAYDAYGNITSNSLGTSYASLMGFQGMVYDVTIGQNVTQAREYNPATGRWNRLDPDGFAAGQSNLYEAEGNDPTDGRDPTGMDVFVNDLTDGKNSLEANDLLAIITTEKIRKVLGLDPQKDIKMRIARYGDTKNGVLTFESIDLAMMRDNSASIEKLEDATLRRILLAIIDPNKHELLDRPDGKLGASTVALNDAMKLALGNFKKKTVVLYDGGESFMEGMAKKIDLNVAMIKSKMPPPWTKDGAGECVVNPQWIDAALDNLEKNVKLIEEIKQKNGKIMDLRIYSHGSPGTFEIGGIHMGAILLALDSSSGTNAQKERFAKILGRLGDTIDPEGCISVWACESNYGDEGKQFFKRLQELLKCRIGGVEKRIVYDRDYQKGTILESVNPRVQIQPQESMTDLFDQVKKLKDKGMNTLFGAKPPDGC